MKRLKGDGVESYIEYGMLLARRFTASRAVRRLIGYDDDEKRNNDDIHVYKQSKDTQ